MGSCIVAIDSEVGFLERLQRKFSDLGLLNEWTLVQIELRASTPSQAIDLCVEELENASVHGRIDLILLDIVIMEEEVPVDRTGLAIADEITKHYPNVPVVAVTGYNREHALLVDVSLHQTIDGIIPKRFLESDTFSRKVFLDILSKSQSKVQRRTGTAARSGEIELTGLGADLDSAEPGAAESADLAIICALELPEMEELLKVQTGWRDVRLALDPTIYHRAEWRREGGGELRVVLATQQRMGLTSCSALAAKIINTWRPKYLGLVGIAAGIAGQPGDILFASSSFDYANGKIHDSSDGAVNFEPAGESLPLDGQILQYANEAKRDGQMLFNVQKMWPGGRNGNLPSLHIGPFACGPFVVASSSFVSDLKKRNRKLVALDMESFAIFNAVADCGGPTKAFVIKAASDDAIMKTDDHQSKAAFNSAQFLYQFAKKYF